MAKEVTTHGRKKISTLMKEFNEMYPYLYIHFHTSEMAEKAKRGETISSINIEKTLAEVREKKGDGEITFSGNKKVKSIEEEFERIYGLYVQICYTTKDGNRYYTSGNDDSKTLAQLNKEKEAEGCKKGVWK